MKFTFAILAIALIVVCSKASAAPEPQFFNFPGRAQEIRQAFRENLADFRQNVIATREARLKRQLVRAIARMPTAPTAASASVTTTAAPTTTTTTTTSAAPTTTPSTTPAAETTTTPAATTKAA